MIRTVNEIGRIPFIIEGGDRYGLTRGILKTVKALTLIETFPNYNQIYFEINLIRTVNSCYEIEKKKNYFMQLRDAFEQNLLC